MLQMFSNNLSGLEVTEGSNIVFDDKVIQLGCTATANTPANSISLNAPGIYKVEFNAIVGPVVASPSDTFVGITLTHNGDVVEGGQTGGALTTGTSQAMSFVTTVTVDSGCCCNRNRAQNNILAFEVSQASITLFYANVVVTKLR